jgi:hypothetical protein
VKIGKAPVVLVDPAERVTFLAGHCRHRRILDVVAAAVSRPSLGTLRGRGETRNGISLPASRPIVRVAGFCLLHDQVN